MAHVRLRVAIVGAGVGGLALAVALQADPSIDVAIYEAQERVEELGAGIGCFGKAVQALRALGMDDALAAIATCPPRDFERLTFRVRRADAEPGRDFATRQFGRGQTFHRAHFLQMFRARLRPSAVSFGKRLVACTDDGALRFADGSAAACDVLVGCDGIRSAVRRCVLAGESEAVWSGTLVYRALFPVAMLRSVHGGPHPLEQGPTAYCGANKNIIAYPVSQGTLINLVLYVTTDPALRGSRWPERMWVADAPASEVLEFAGWEHEVQSILQCATGLQMTKWAVHEVPPLPFFARGRVALTGDAAHAMQSHSGSGANQTIEDVYMLAQLLMHRATNADNVGAALAVYDAVRRPYAQGVAASSAEAGEMLQLLGKYADPTDDELRAMGRRLETYDEWHKDGDIAHDVAQALQLLEKSIGKDAPGRFGVMQDEVQQQ